MNEKIRVNIYVDKYAWEELPKYIACSKSNWINEQILKKDFLHCFVEINYDNLKPNI